MRCPAPPLFLLLALAACGAEAAPAGPTVFVSLDQEFSEPVLKRFAAELGIELHQVHDTESSKTVGLVNRLYEEKAHPRCTVYWNNELAHTVQLAQAGLLEPYDSPSAQDIPAQWRDPAHHWNGFAARARIIVVNTELLPDQAEWPKSYADLVDPKWKGRCGIAKPKTGTTLTHFTALRGALGEEAFARFLDGLFTNEVRFLASNAASLAEVRDGRIAWSFTDTDDYHVAKKKGFPVSCVFPDQQDGGIGTMLVPNSVALIKGGPAQAEGKRLIDKILARETEALLAAADGAQIPLRAGIAGPGDPTILPSTAFRAMQWDVTWTATNLARCLEEWSRRFGP